MKLTLHLIILSLFSTNLLAQVPESPEEFTERLSRFGEAFLQEKAYLHMDKQNYLAGETIWFKAYLLAGSNHLPICPSKLMYVELLSPEEEVIASRNIKIEEGSGMGDILTNPKWKAGTYQLRAYTSYMRNYDENWIFTQEILLRSAFQQEGQQEDKKRQPIGPPISVQFFPEGGDLIVGLENNIAFKAVNRKGLAEEVKGQILDGDGNPILDFSSEGMGLGKFTLSPAIGKSYSAKIDWQGEEYSFPLPAPQNFGYNLQANFLPDTDTLSLNLQSNIPNGLEGAYLIAHLRGQVFGLIPGLKGNQIKLKLDLSSIPSGIAHFTLFDPGGKPVAERLVGLNRPMDYPMVFATGLKERYGKREKVSLNIQVPPTNPADSFKTDLSMVVRDIRNVVEAKDIRSYLWLSSDIHGPVEKPWLFLDPQNKSLLDLLMMTQGWRRFNWDEFIAEVYPPLTYPIEKGFRVKGYVQDLYKPGRREKAALTLSSLDEQNFFMAEAVSNEEGEFLFGEYPFEDSINLLLQARRYKSNAKKQAKKKNKNEFKLEGSRSVRIIVDEVEAPEVQWRVGKIEAFGEWQLNFQDTFMIKKLAFEQGVPNFELEEVQIQARLKRQEDPFFRSGMLYKEPDGRIILDSTNLGSQALTIFELIRGRVPGVEIIGTPFVNQTARIRGFNSIQLSSTATILLDGVIVEPLAANLIQVRNVEFVDVIKSLSKTSVYGAAGSGGIIAIYTRQGSGISPQWQAKEAGVINHLHPGFYKAREFYNPVYTSRSGGSSDFRSTLAWEGQLQPDANGQATLSFYTSDVSGTFEIDIQGIDAKGNPVVKRMEFVVE